MSIIAHEFWKLQCRINRRLPGGPDGKIDVTFRPVGRSIDVLGGAEPRPRPALAVVITTYARAEPCRVLVRSLAELLRRAGVERDAFVVVLRDHSEHDYGVVFDELNEAHGGRFAFYESSRWLGKPGRFHGYQTAFDAVRVLQPEHTIFLEDDVALSGSFVSESISRFRAITDPRKAVLYLCKFDDDEADGRWIRFRPRAVPPHGVALTQWFDLQAFIVNQRFFETLRWRLFQPYASRWKGNPALSSGVSEQFTRRLWKRANVYQVCESLAFHGKLPSVLNVDARRVRPLNNFPAAFDAAAKS